MSWRATEPAFHLYEQLDPPQDISHPLREIHRDATAILWGQADQAVAR